MVVHAGGDSQAEQCSQAQPSIRSAVRPAIPATGYSAHARLE